MKWKVLFVLAVWFSACAQVLLKAGAERAGRKQKNVFLQPQSLLGYAVYALTAAASMCLYRYVDLSQGVQLESLGYVFVLFLAGTVLGEKISRRQCIGTGLILAGVLTAAWA